MAVRIDGQPSGVPRALIRRGATAKETWPPVSAVPGAELTEYVEGRLTWMRKVAYLLCEDWQRADDLVQATATRLFTHWSRVRVMDNIDGYVRTIMVRCFLG